jgi:SAM-dependent methyltransferase
MRAMAERVGPAGRVLGIDRDASLGALAVEMLHGEGHRQCSFREHDLSRAEAVPGGPFDLVYARLLLFHLPERVEVLARLWDAVAPGGYLLVQDYDIRGVSTLPQLDWLGEVHRIICGAFSAVGADGSAGARLPQLFAQAGIGDPDGTDVAGRIEPLATAGTYLADTLRSLLPAALAHGVTTADGGAAALDSISRDASRFPHHQMLWPLLIGAWKRKEQT